MINRFNNMEQANVDKMINAAQTLLNDIKTIKENNSLDLLDEKEQVVIKYREKYEEASLLELSQIISYETGINITKSGVNHRIKKIQELARKIKEKENKK